LSWLLSASLVSPLPSLARTVSDDTHTRRDPSVLLPGSPGRPEFDGRVFPTRSAFYFATDPERPSSSTTRIPDSVVTLALKLKPVPKPEELLAAIEKLKKADTPETQREAAGALARVLGPEGVKAFTDERTGKLDLPELLRALTFLESEDELKKAKDGNVGSREEMLAQELARLGEPVPPAPPRRDDNGGNGELPPPAPDVQTPKGELPPPGPDVENPGPGTGGPGVGNGDPPIIDPGDGGLGIGNNLFDPFAFDPNQAALDQLAQLQDALANTQDELDRARAAGNRNREPGLPNPGGGGGKDPLPLPQPGGGSPPSLTRQNLEIPPATIPDPVAPAAMVMPPVMPETPLSAETVNKLSGGMLPPTPQPSSTFDKLMQETAALRESGMQVLQSIYSRLNAVVASPQLTSPPASAGGVRTIGDMLRTPGLFPNRRPPGAPRPPDRYPGVPGNVVGGPPGLGAPPTGQTLRPPPSLGPGGPPGGTVTPPARTRAVASGERRTTSR
jgi:hypothetical protein